MAQYKLDSKGRLVGKILNEEEYAEHQKTGCFTKIFFFIIFIVIVIAIAVNGEKNEGKGGSEKIEKAAPKESSQLEVSTTQSKAQKEATDSKEQQSSVETTPLLDADMVSSSESVEAIEQESQDLDVSSMTDDSEQEQHLSRKERRALKKAQKRLKKEMEKEND